MVSYYLLISPCMLGNISNKWSGVPLPNLRMTSLKYNHYLSSVQDLMIVIFQTPPEGSPQKSLETFSLLDHYKCLNIDTRQINIRLSGIICAIGTILHFNYIF